MYFFILLFSVSAISTRGFRLIVTSLADDIDILPKNDASVNSNELIKTKIDRLRFLSGCCGSLTGSGSAARDAARNSSGGTRRRCRRVRLSRSRGVSRRVRGRLRGADLRSTMRISFGTRCIRLDLGKTLLFRSNGTSMVRRTCPMIGGVSSVLTTCRSGLVRVRKRASGIPISSHSGCRDGSILSVCETLDITGCVESGADLGPTRVGSSKEKSCSPITSGSAPRKETEGEHMRVGICGSCGSRFGAGWSKGRYV